MTLLARRLLLTVTGLGVFTLAGCGQNPPPRPAWPTLTVDLNVPSRTLRLPLTVAQNLNLFAGQHIQLRWSHSPSAPVHVSWTPGSWPIVGSIAQGPDFYLAAPEPDPHFRLRALNHLPVDYSATLEPARPLIDSIMALNQVRPDLEPLPWPKVQSLWSRRQLPWAIVTLAQLRELQQKDRRTVILNWLGASTGPIPAVTISGNSPHLAQFLAALNMALWYIHTTPAHTVAAVANPAHAASWRQIVMQGQHNHLWPSSIQVSPQEYNRARALYGLRGSPGWPPYYSGVLNSPSDQAFKATY